MFGDFKEILQLVALFLGIFVPAISVYWVYRKEMAKVVGPPTVGTAGLIAIAGGLTSREGMKDYIESQENMSQSIMGLKHAVLEGTLSIAKTGRENNEELRKAAMALQDIAHLMRNQQSRGNP